MKKRRFLCLPKTTSLFPIVFGIFFALFGASTYATLWTLPGGATWNNSQFLSADFWNSNPSTGDIIQALYGSGNEGSAYTQTWSGYSAASCLDSGMNVVYVGQLTFNNLAANTIYVVTGSSTIKTDTNSIQMNDCTAVVSSNSLGTKIYSNSAMTLAMIGPQTNKKYGIIDHIDLDGANNGAGGAHTRNSFALASNAGSNNTTFNNMKIYNANVGISLVGPTKFLINNVQVYNNTSHGISISAGGYNTINNTQAYNNYGNGILFWNNSNYNTINNTQTYNNGRNGCGISLYSGQWNTINNTQIYNNDYGICVYIASNNFHTVDIYNNNNSTRIAATATNIKFYGQNTIFNNLETVISPGFGNLTTGSSSDYPSLGWTTGSLILSGKTMSRDYITNPINGSGNYLLSWTKAFTGLMGTGTFTATQPVRYSYGSGIFLQDQPVYYSGTILVTGGLFDTTKYIGDDTVKLTGSLSGTLPTRTNSTGTYTIQPLASIATGYTLFGNLVGTPYSAAIGTSTGIKLTTGDGQKNIITQIYGPFATHFQTTMFLDQTPPTFDFNNVGGGECISSAHLTLAYAVDTGVGLGSTPYSFDGSTWTGNATLDIPTQQPGTQTRTGRVRDSLGNSSYKVATFTFSDILPTANDFTGNANVSNVPQTANWITQSNVREGIKCGSTDISYSGMIAQATKGVCTVSGSGITYTPNLNQTGTDSCTIQAKDNENNTVNIIVYRENIDTTLNCLSGWNNDNFLTTGFWNQNPTRGNVICALYGSGGNDTTAYTSNWSGRTSSQCSGAYMNVIETNTLPATLSGNTIYVLTGEQAIVSDTRNLATCSAVISKNTSGTTLYSSTQIASNGILNSTNKQYIIFDNLSIEGTNDGIGDLHNINYIAIALRDRSNNNTFNKLKIYNNSYGISFADSSNNYINNINFFNNINVGLGLQQSSDNNTTNNIKLFDNGIGLALWSSAKNNIKNIEAYNNVYGINLSTSNNNIINNSKFYNNQSHGIRLALSSNNSINNSQSYNNNAYGIRFTSSSNNSINNFQTYNNNSYGIYLQSSSNNSINNAQVYDNNNYGINIDLNSTGNLYYGKLNMFGNQILGIGGYSNNLSTGNSSDTLVQGLNRTTGELITTGTMSWNYVTNPISTSGNYLLSWSGSWANIRGRQTAYSGMITSAYSFGSGILLQSQPVIYSGTTLLTSGSFDATKYIGSDLIKVTGELLGLPAATTGVNFTVTGNSTNGNIHNYSLFGDINNFSNTLGVGTETGITLTAGDGQKRVITQLFGTLYFATHFQTTMFLDTTKPSFTFANASGAEFTTGLLTITNVLDTGAGIASSGYARSTDGSTFDDWTNREYYEFAPATEPGTQTVRVKLRDAAGNESLLHSGSFTRTNIAPSAANLSGIADEGAAIIFTALGSDPGGTVFTYQWFSGASCTGTTLATQNIFTGTMSGAGIGVRSYKILDAQGSESTCALATGTWKDITAPTADIAYSTTQLTSGAVIATLTGFSEPITIMNTNGLDYSTFTENGTFTFLFADSAGNTGSATATVDRIDTTPPNIYLNGASSLIKEYGSLYTELGATRDDIVDGTGIISQISGEVNTRILGTYTLYYSYTDHAGNVGTASRIVTVVDTTSPILTLNGSDEIFVEYGTSYSDAGATWTDLHDGSGTLTAIGTVDTRTLGTYILEYQYIDMSGNTGNIISRTVHVVDTTPPVINETSITPDMIGSTGQITITQTITDANNVSGASVVILDPLGGTTQLTLSLVSGNTQEGIWSGVYVFDAPGIPDGIYLLSGYAYDSQGNTGNASLGQIILDRTAPTFSLITLSPQYVGGSGNVTIHVVAQDSLVGIASITARDTSSDIFATLVSGSNFPTAAGEIGSRTFLQTVVGTEGTHDEEIIANDLLDNSRNYTVPFIYDITAPTADIVYSSTELTSGAVIATLTGFSEPITIMNTNGLDYSTFTENGTFTFLFADSAGNTGSATATVDRIDTTPPTATITYTPPAGQTTSGEVVAFAQLNESGVFLTSGDAYHTFTENGYFTFMFADLLGNIGSAVAHVDWIHADIPLPFLPPTRPSGGSTILVQDVCPESRDCSSSYYDNLCGPCPEAHGSADPVGDITDSPYSQEINEAYQRAYSLGITSIGTIQNARIDNTIIREHLAKVMTEFAIKVLKMKPNTKLVCSFSDIAQETPEMRFYMKTACQLGLMGLKSDGKTPDTIFTPRATITRAQFGTILSRLIYGDVYNIYPGETNRYAWYEKHLAALYQDNIIRTTSVPTMYEKKARVFLMLKRTVDEGLIAKYHTTFSSNK